MAHGRELYPQTFGCAQDKLLFSLHWPRSAEKLSILKKEASFTSDDGTSLDAKSSERTVRQPFYETLVRVAMETT